MPPKTVMAPLKTLGFAGFSVFLLILLSGSFLLISVDFCYSVNSVSLLVSVLASVRFF